MDQILSALETLCQFLFLKNIQNLEDHTDLIIKVEWAEFQSDLPMTEEDGFKAKPSQSLIHTKSIGY